MAGFRASAELLKKKKIFLTLISVRFFDKALSIILNQ